MAVSIFGYSNAFLVNANAKSLTQGAQGAGPTGAPLQIYEPKLNWAEKQGDSPYEVVACAIPVTRFDGTALAVGDQFVFAPLGGGVKIEFLALNITTACGGTLTMNIGNNTSATAYASGVNMAAAAVTTATLVALNAAAAGNGPNDAIIGTVATTTAPTGPLVATLNIQYGTP